MTISDTPGPKPSGFQRIIGVLISPDETFASIARQPDFLAPLLLILILAVVGGIIFAQRVDFAAPAREAMEQRGNMSEAQMESALKISAAIGKIFSYGAPVVSVIVLLIVSAVLLLAFRMMGGEGTFKQAFAATVYAWMPLTILNIILLVIIMAKTGITALDLPTLVMSNPAFLVTMKEHPFLFALLASIDIFTIWTLVLFIFGFSHLSKFSKSKSAAVVITVWVIWTCIKLIGPTIRALKG
ncbi:MAG: YIP1 family protein [Acidobacteriota bacterium]|nr:YIP1 family protein [Acidobacteriota bacterium]